MTFLPITNYDQLDAAAKAASDSHVERYGGPIGNLDATLLGHLPFIGPTRTRFLDADLVSA